MIVQCRKWHEPSTEHEMAVATSERGWLYVAPLDTDRVEDIRHKAVARYARKHVRMRSGDTVFVEVIPQRAVVLPPIHTWIPYRVRCVFAIGRIAVVTTERTTTETVRAALRRKSDGSVASANGSSP